MWPWNTIKRRHANDAAVMNGQSSADLQRKLDQRTRELAEALEQQAATWEVLRVISSSPGELDLVFKSVLEKATRICEANFGNLYLCDADGFRLAQTHNTPPKLFEERKRASYRPDPRNAFGRMASAKSVIHISDLAAEETYFEGDPGTVLAVEAGGIRTLLFVPLLKANELIGTLAIYRQEVRPFTEKQIALVTSFASQAVIAIENTRLLNELRESLQQQTATADVLKVISSSPGDLKPVFEAMLESATRLCAAKFGSLFLREGDSFRSVAMHSVPSAYLESYQRDPIIDLKDLHPNAPLPQLVETQKIVHIADLRMERAYINRDPRIVALVEGAGARTDLLVPMLKENELIGAFAIYRQEVLPFTAKQIELVQSFAAQAVIAIENARLLSELRQRTSDLTESLERQTATSDVLRVISSSPGDLRPVFDAILANAMRICGDQYGSLLLFDGSKMRVMALHNAPPEFVELRKNNPVIPLEKSILGPLVKTKRLSHVADITAEEPYANSPIAKFGMRTALGIPMIRDDQLIGAIAAYRSEVRPFTDKQIEFLTNFASQAVIAIENTRLLNELRQSLEQQTATADVLHVISSSPGELEPVFDAMLENATRFCGPSSGPCILGRVRRFAPSRCMARRRHMPMALHGQADQSPGATSGLGRVMQTKQVVHVADFRPRRLIASAIPCALRRRS